MKGLSKKSNAARSKVKKHRIGKRDGYYTTWGGPAERGLRIFE